MPTPLAPRSSLAWLVARGLVALSPDGDGNAGGGTATQTPPKPKPMLSDGAPREVREVFREFSRNPVAMSHEIVKLRGAAVAVPDGGIALTKEQRERFEAYEALGVAPADVRTRLAERDTLQADAATRTAREARETLFVETAGSLGWNTDAARKAAARITLDGATLERREDEVDDGRGGKVKKPFAYVVTGTGSTAKAERLDTVIQRDHDLYLPALTAATMTSTTPAPAPPRGPAFTPQSGTGATAAPPSMIDAMLAKSAASASAPNALRPAAPAVKAAA